MPNVMLTVLQLSIILNKIHDKQKTFVLNFDKKFSKVASVVFFKKNICSSFHLASLGSNKHDKENSESSKVPLSIYYAIS